METLTKPPRLISVEEYLKREARSEVRHEYVEGTLYALAGGSDHHNRIAGNIYMALRLEARDTSCRVYMSDMRVMIGNVYYYPDVMVCCEKPETENSIFRYDPCLLVEVLSTTTKAIDRREKLLVYRQIPTLRAYLIVDQQTRHVERHFRDKHGEWQRADIINDGSVPVPCPDTELTLADVYREI